MEDGFRIFGDFFHAYLRERDLNKILAMVSENIISLGTGRQEIAIGKDELEKLFLTEFEISPDPVEFEIIETREFRASPGCISFFAKIRVFMGAMQEPALALNPFVCRFTGSCSLADGKWLIDSMHMSLPSSEQREDSFFPDLHHRIMDDFSPEELQWALATSIPNIMPCGILCAYTEKGLPFYLVNDELLHYVDYSYDEFLDITEGLSINIVHPDDRAMVQGKAFEGLKSAREYDAQFRLLKKDGTFVWVYARGKPLKLTDGRDIFVSVAINISKMVAMQEKLSDEASKDVLTPVFNRRAMIEMVESSFIHNSIGCFFIIDIDNFKHLNDTQGHQAGDAILKDAAALMLRRTRATDIVARLGGDEFAIYYPGLENPVVAKRRADQLREDFFQLVTQKYGAKNISLSIGSVFRSGNMSFDEIYRSADEALYAVKRRGKDGYGLYQASAPAPAADNSVPAESGVKASKNRRRRRSRNQPEKSPVER